MQTLAKPDVSGTLSFDSHVNTFILYENPHTSPKVVVNATQFTGLIPGFSNQTDMYFGFENKKRLTINGGCLEHFRNQLFQLGLDPSRVTITVESKDFTRIEYLERSHRLKGWENTIDFDRMVEVLQIILY